jgi:cholesterol oxidase
VDSIEPLDGQGYKVSFRELDPDHPERGEPGHVIGKKIIVSAGTLGSNRLLLRCRDVHHTLPNLSRSLGRRYSQNGDFLFAGTLFPERIVDSERGPNITAGAEVTTHGQPMLVQDLAYPDPFMWAAWGLLQVRNPPEVLWHGLKLWVEGVLRAPGETQRLFREWQELNENTVSSRLLPYLVMGMDAADGRCKLDAQGDLDIEWEHAASMPMLRAIEDTLIAMSRAMDAKYVPSPLWQWPLRKLLTAHPLGGCVMADSPRGGVVNEWGEVWNYPDLYVVDASIIPSSLLVNPSATISALAERIAFHIICGRELVPGDPATPANL